MPARTVKTGYPMNQALPPLRLHWQDATVTRVLDRTPTVKSFFLRPADPFSFVAGQHVDVRVALREGREAERSYSIASAPGDPEVELVIERLPTAEVSAIFHDGLHPGDRVALRGPIGSGFNWLPGDGGPTILIGGGTGVVPLVSMLQARRKAGITAPFALIYSARSLADVIFRDELARMSEKDPDVSIIVTLTRETSAADHVRLGRIDRALVASTVAALGGSPRTAFVCGGTAFVDVATLFLEEAGMPRDRIRAERYGGTPAAHLDTSVTVAPEA